MSDSSRSGSENDSKVKVNDTRHHAKHDEKAPSEGPGFTMKEGVKEDSGAPTELDFSTLVFSLATSAMINLGLTPDPATQKTGKDLELAKQNIDILAMLQKKTKGNLTPEEDGLLNGLLTEARLKFVEAQK